MDFEYSEIRSLLKNEGSETKFCYCQQLSKELRVVMHIHIQHSALYCTTPNCKHVGSNTSSVNNFQYYFFSQCLWGTPRFHFRCSLFDLFLYKHYLPRSNLQWIKHNGIRMTHSRTGNKRLNICFNITILHSISSYCQSSTAPLWILKPCLQLEEKTGNYYLMSWKYYIKPDWCMLGATASCWYEQRFLLFNRIVI